MSEKDSRLSLARRALTSLLLSLWFVLVYTATNYLTTLRSDVGTAAFAWESKIPFLPWFIIPYWSIDLFFVLAPFVISSRAELDLFAKRIFLAIAVAGTCFLLFPLRLVFLRPEVPGLLGLLFGSLDELYNFHNLAPSLHIALRCLLWPVYIPRARGALRVFLEIWFVLIGISTLVCWQHHVVDVFSGQLLGLTLIHLVMPRDQVRDANLARGINANWSIACKYWAGSIGFIFFVSVLPLWGIIFLWPAAALLVVGCAYAGFGPGIYRKRAGLIPMGTRVFFAPFYFGLWLSFLYFTSGQTSYVEILPGLFMGRALREEEARLLREQGVCCVLDLTAEWSEAKSFRALEYRNVALLDLSLPSKTQLEEAYNALVAWNGKGGVYVHCSLGLTRASVLVLYYLCRSGRFPSLEEALMHVRSLRSSIVLGPKKLSYLTELLEG